MLECYVYCHQKDLDTLINAIERDGGQVIRGEVFKNNLLLVNLIIKIETVLQVNPDILQVEKNLRDNGRMLLGWQWKRGQEDRVTIYSCKAIFKEKDGKFCYERKKICRIR